jgi:hypothetical protein
MAGGVERSNGICVERRGDVQRSELHQYRGGDESPTGYEPGVLDRAGGARGNWGDGSNRRCRSDRRERDDGSYGDCRGNRRSRNNRSSRNNGRNRGNRRNRRCGKCGRGGRSRLAVAGGVERRDGVCDERRGDVQRDELHQYRGGDESPTGYQLGVLERAGGARSDGRERNDRSDRDCRGNRGSGNNGRDGDNRGCRSDGRERDDRSDRDCRGNRSSRNNGRDGSNRGCRSDG